MNKKRNLNIPTNQPQAPMESNFIKKIILQHKKNHLSNLWNSNSHKFFSFLFETLTESVRFFIHLAIFQSFPNFQSWTHQDVRTKTWNRSSTQHFDQLQEEEQLQEITQQCQLQEAQDNRLLRWIIIMTWCVFASSLHHKWWLKWLQMVVIVPVIWIKWVTIWT